MRAHAVARARGAERDARPQGRLARARVAVRQSALHLEMSQGKLACSALDLPRLTNDKS